MKANRRLSTHDFVFFKCIVWIFVPFISLDYWITNFALPYWCDQVFCSCLYFRMRMGTRWWMNMSVSIRLALEVTGKWYVSLYYSFQRTFTAKFLDFIGFEYAIGFIPEPSRWKALCNKGIVCVSTEPSAGVWNYFKQNSALLGLSITFISIFFFISIVIAIFLFIWQAFHKSHLLRLRVAPSETAMTDVLREVCHWSIICACTWIKVFELWLYVIFCSCSW